MRVAGDKPYYTFVLRNENTGRYVKDVTIQLPSVTTIISKTLAKPALMPWTYRTTRDYIAGTFQTLLQSKVWVGTDLLELLETFSDADMLEEYLKENRLRPEDTTKDASTRGNEGHATLEELGRLSLYEDEVALKAASKILADARASDVDKGIAGWWLDRQPHVVESESVLYSLKHGFVGSVDLIWRDLQDRLVVTDLKTRGVDKGIYESDHIQCGAYAIAFEEMRNEPVAFTTVLVVREDGSWIEEASPLPEDTFLHVLSLYNALKG